MRRWGDFKIFTLRVDLMVSVLQSQSRSLGDAVFSQTTCRTISTHPTEKCTAAEFLIYFTKPNKWGEKKKKNHVLIVHTATSFYSSVRSCRLCSNVTGSSNLAG